MTSTTRPHLDITAYSIGEKLQQPKSSAKCTQTIPIHSIISKLDKHVVLLLINYIAGYLIQIFCVSQTRHIVHSNLSVCWNKNTLQDLKKDYFYSVIQLILYKKTNVDLVLLLRWSEWYGPTGKNRNFEYKEDKATAQILDLSIKTIENKYLKFIHYLKQFPQTLSVCSCNVII